MLQPWYETLGPRHAQETEAVPWSVFAPLEDAYTDLFQLEAYELVLLAAERCRDLDAAKALGNTKPSYVLLQRHERWAVPVMKIHRP